MRNGQNRQCYVVIQKIIIVAQEVFYLYFTVGDAKEGFKNANNFFKNRLSLNNFFMYV